jgi:hypothetical protein
MDTRRLASFQGQIETVFKMSLTDLDLRIKKSFGVLRIKSHLTGAGIRKWDGYAPSQLLFVLINLVFLHVNSVHDLMKRFVDTFFEARKDTFYRFKNGEWSWRPFYWRFIRHLGTKLDWSATADENCFIVDTSVLAKRGKKMEHLSFVYDHTQRKTVNGYEMVTLGLITPTNFYPLDFGYRFSTRRYEQARDATVCEPAGSLAKRIREAQSLKKPQLAIKMLKEALAKGIPSSYLLVDAWFASPKFFKDAKALGLHTIARLKNNKTRYLYQGRWLGLSALYDSVNPTLIKNKELGCLLRALAIRCRNGLEGTIVFVKGYKEPDLDMLAGSKKTPEPNWVAIFSTDRELRACEVVKKYILRWSIAVFFKEAKQRLGLGKDHSRSFAAQVFSTTQVFIRYSMLGYLLGHEPSHHSIGDMFHEIVQETATVTYFERLWTYFAMILRRCLETLDSFLDPGIEFRYYIEAISNAFHNIKPLRGCET